MAGIGRHAPLPGTGVAFDAAFLRGSTAATATVMLASAAMNPAIHLSPLLLPSYPLCLFAATPTLETSCSYLIAKHRLCCTAY
jgi:hypothetical protein